MDVLENFKKINSWEINNVNDRRILVLLKHKEVRTKAESRRLNQLTDLYPDNEKCEEAIITELRPRGFIKMMNLKVELNEEGYYIETITGLPKYLQTTEEGENALKNQLFPSEFKDKQRDKLFRLLQIIGLSIAAGGGLITILKWCCELLL